MIVFRQKGNFSKTEKMLQEKSIDIKKINIQNGLFVLELFYWRWLNDMVIYYTNNFGYWILVFRFFFF